MNLSGPIYHLDLLKSTVLLGFRVIPLPPVSHTSPLSLLPCLLPCIIYGLFPALDAKFLFWHEQRKVISFYLDLLHTKWRKCCVWALFNGGIGAFIWGFFKVIKLEKWMEYQKQIINAFKNSLCNRLNSHSIPKLIFSTCMHQWLQGFRSTEVLLISIARWQAQNGWVANQEAHGKNYLPTSIEAA